MEEYYKIVRVEHAYKCDKVEHVIKVLKGVNEAIKFANNFIEDWNSLTMLNQISTGEFNRISLIQYEFQEFDNRRYYCKFYGTYKVADHYIQIEQIDLESFIKEEENKIKLFEDDLMKKIQNKKDELCNILSELNNLS